MGKVLDVVVAVIVVLFAIYAFVRMGITLGDLVHDFKLFVYGSKASLLLMGMV